MLSYQEIYLKLLDSQQFERLEKLMEEQNVYGSLRVTESLLERKDGFPYILLRIETDQVFAAQMVGLLLQIHHILPEYTDHYYLPVITMANGYDPQIKNLINQDNSITHELIHIKDILSLIDKDPSYLQRITLYNLNKLESSECLSESIDIEVFKIFYLEPQAFENDFNHGEKTIRTVFLGKLMEYECETKQEYIEMQISDYLGNLSGAYKNKFPNDKELIENQIASSVIKYGEDVFGTTPLEKLKKVRKAYPPKMLSSMLNARK